MNNKPVAIVKKMTIGGIDNFPIERFVSLKEGTLLYTHPTKTLTDEEIIEITIRWFGSRRNDFFPEQWLDFARAILKKASEK